MARGRRTGQTTGTGKRVGHSVTGRTRHRTILVRLQALAGRTVLVALHTVLVERFRVRLGIARLLSELILVDRGRTSVRLLLVLVLLPYRHGVGVRVGQLQITVLVEVGRLTVGLILATRTVRRLEALLLRIGGT